MRKISRTFRNKRKRGGALNFSNVTQSDNYGAGKYVLNTYGNTEQQFNNTFKQNGTQNSSNTIMTLKGKSFGGRHKSKRNHKRGGFISNVVNQAVVPLTLLGLQQRFKNKRNQSAKTRKRFRQ